MVAQEYEQNMAEQEDLACLKRYPTVDKFLSKCLDLLKYFGAWTGLVSFLWCELGSTAQKELPICLPDGQKKLLDGIGFDQSSLERILIERSGEKDGDHTEEDTLKIMECSHHCLKTEMDHLLYASWDTFTNRRILSIQCVSDKITLLSTRCLKTGKWCLVEVRSAIVPRDWRRRNSWARVMDLLFKLQELLVEQEEITAKLDREHTRRVYVDPNNTIQSRLRRLHNSPADEHLTD
ncbi:hypothetical protein BX666DRAFT_152713 [Dichotomocladium elegans]|nr:hypothetical protein BX666DRAFT_152713 [Dichotomocladium elegans]